MVGRGNYKTKDQTECQTEFREATAIYNIGRGKLFADVIIIIELILLTLSFLSTKWIETKNFTEKTSFSYEFYSEMYLLMIAVMIIMRIAFAKMEESFQQNQRKVASVEVLTIFFATFIMSWGAAISLYDQRIYGNIVVYMVNMIGGTLIFYIEAKYLAIAYIVSLLILLLGLPFYQPSIGVLFGHYVNITIFAALAWITGKKIYDNYVVSFLSNCEVSEKNILLAKRNEELRQEIARREETQIQLKKANEELASLSLQDELTGIPNRRSLELFLRYAWQHAVREKTHISFIIIDIDYFKAFNDNYGHLLGDECLKIVAQSLSENTRALDFVARHGGEEFIMVVLNADEEGTGILAENLRQKVEALEIQHEYSPISDYLTISLGTTTVIPRDGDSILDCLNKADQALYQAKNAGRNTVSRVP